MLSQLWNMSVQFFLEVSACLHVSTWLDRSVLLPKQAANHGSAFFLLHYFTNDVNQLLHSSTSNRVGMQTSSIKRPIIMKASGGSDTISVTPSSPSPPSVSLTNFEAFGIIMHTPTTWLSNISMLMPVSYTALIKDCFCDTSKGLMEYSQKAQRGEEKGE